MRISRVFLLWSELPASSARKFAALSIVMMGVWAMDSVWAATSYNATSPMGTNLAQVNYYTSEQPFLDIFKTSAGFSTIAGYSDTGEEKYLNVDANGWPMTLTTVNDPNPQKFTQLSTLLLDNLPSTPNGAYPAGQYVVRYQGEGTIT